MQPFKPEAEIPLAQIVWEGGRRGIHTPTTPNFERELY